MIYHLGLGSNLGDPVRQVARARAWIERRAGRIRKFSSLYLTEPVGFRDQPWFLNQVLEVESYLSPAEMLAAFKKIEQRMKRAPARRDGPRLIDIDILLAEETIIRTASLTVPHPRLAERNFALVPLAEIAARRRHPVLGLTIAALKRNCLDSSRVMRLKIPSRD